jgi:CBS domain-containing protein/RimJ/RimL family protein N-acetyltransferase
MHNNNVGTWMTPSPLTIGPEDSVWDAYEKMKRHHIRRLPVVDGKTLVGIITITDVRSLAPMGALPLIEQNGLIENTKVARVMTSNPITITSDENVGEAARLMMKYKISGLPVMENGQLIGVISEADLFRLVIADHWHPWANSPVGSDGEIMLKLRGGESITIRTIRPDDAGRLQAAFAQMSPETVYDRFMGYKKVLLDQEAHDLTSLDYQCHMALVATTAEANGEGTIIGVARYYVLDDDPSCAEFAIVINDAYQRQGLGTQLLMRLMEYAQVHGIRTFLGYAHGENYRLLRFVQRTGLPIDRKLKDGLWEVRLHLEGVDFSTSENFFPNHMEVPHEHQHS